MAENNQKNSKKQQQNQSKKIGTVLFVKDMNASKKFYTEYLDQEIEMDIGKNVGFKSGLALWEYNYALKTIYEKEETNMNKKNSAMELYIEYENIEEIENKLISGNINFIHKARAQPWGQLTIRFYDLDENIIEIGEPMYMVILRYAKAGDKAEIIAQKTFMPLEIVNQVLENLMK